MTICTVRNVKEYPIQIVNLSYSLFLAGESITYSGENVNELCILGINSHLFLCLVKKWYTGKFSGAILTYTYGIKSFVMHNMRNASV